MLLFAFRMTLIQLAVLSIGLATSASASAATFEQVCALSTTVKCWGFESEDNMRYVWDSGDAKCNSDPFLLNHPNGKNRMSRDLQSGLGNTTAKTTTARNGGECVYPKRDGAHS